MQNNSDDVELYVLVSKDDCSIKFVTVLMDLQQFSREECDL